MRIGNRSPDESFSFDGAWARWLDKRCRMLDAAPDCVFPNRTFYDLGINNPVISVSGKHRICRRVDFLARKLWKGRPGYLVKRCFHVVDWMHTSGTSSCCKEVNSFSSLRTIGHCCRKGTIPCQSRTAKKDKLGRKNVLNWHYKCEAEKEEERIMPPLFTKVSYSSSLWTILPSSISQQTHRGGYCCCCCCCGWWWARRRR